MKLIKGTTTKLGTNTHIFFIVCYSQLIIKTMIDYKKYTPEINLPIIVKTSWGEERKAVLDPYFTGFGGYRLTDCTHPMQNCYLAPHDIIEWEYENEQYMSECRFIENTIEKRKTADKILESIKVTWWDKLKYRLYWL